MAPTKSPHDAYTLVSSAHHDTVYSDFQDIGSGKFVDLDAQLMASIRDHHPGMTVTVIPSNYANLAGYAAAGFARIELDTSEDFYLRWRVYVPAPVRGGPGHLADAYFFARYKYTWKNIEFIVYTVREGLMVLNYILFPPDDDENVLSHSKVTDALLKAIGEVQFTVEATLLVFDRYWSRSRALYEEVQKTTWNDVILSKKMKTTLTETVVHFFDSKQTYKDLGVPWKRGIILFGPPGNGKTLSIKALMHTLSVRPDPVVCLYVKSMRSFYDMRSVFVVARQMAPCLLILEDIDTLVSPTQRSYFFNEVDGLENNDGIMMVATTNYIDQLDGGLAKRPSRFDRKYEFPVPGRDERILYCDFWRRKLQHNKNVDFPEKLSPAIADITKDFTFAYLKEAFLAALLAIANSEQEDDDNGEQEDGDEGESSETLVGLPSPRNNNTESHSEPAKDDKDIAHLRLWILIQKEIKILREDMDSSDKRQATPGMPRVNPADGYFPVYQTEHDSAKLFPIGEAEVQEDLIKMRAEFNRRTGTSMPKYAKGCTDLVPTADPQKENVAELVTGWEALTVADKEAV